NNELKINQNIFIYKQEFHYIKNVLRMKNQDILEIFNNTNYIFFSKIINIQKKDIQIKILEKKFENYESNIDIHL
ncbi:MAG: 16S rRNA (uracil(1498)-N(3))-methyltransferase, partial [Buchnera aphidicola]|nr:16S rRNA (uracil(1498)-N(3))-methyltransferase [Buchnera aphidicola]MDE5286136.1 16S rRNA (uracil(1498)-N(3))-methyltransferase [Buchnera aphidicola]